VCVPDPFQPAGTLMAKYVEVLFRFRLRLTIILLIAFAGGAYLFVSFASYQATATMRVESPSSFGATFVPIGWSPSLTPAENLSDSISQVVKAPAFAQSLSEKLSGSGAVSSSAELQQIVGSVGSNLRISVSGSHVLTLNYTCHRADLCAPVLNQTITVFREQLLQSQQAQADATTAFWKGQLKDAQASLASAEAALRSYATANPNVSTDANSGDPQVVQLLDSVRQWKDKVVEAQNNVSLAQYLSTSSARFSQLGTKVVDTPRLASSRTLGDGSSLRLAALALLAGLLTIVVYAAFLTWVDKTVGDPSHLERRLGVPVVATIPKLVSSRG
jgi:uncharacterized protein involved in exopolysaccharide biosynthesis